MAEPGPATNAVERALLARNVGAVFLPERVVRRVIKEHRQIGGIGFQVPHSHCYTLPNWALKKIVEKDELGELDAGHDAALVLPSVAGEADDVALVAVWRAAFHASVHRALEARIMAGELPPAAVRARIHALGQTEFDEIRYVLGQDDLLLPPHDDTEAYLEFAASWLEQHYFAPDLLLRTFPGLRDASALVLRTLSRDLDADALLAACRPEGAPAIADLWARVSEPPSSRTTAPVAPVAHGQRDVVDPAADIARAQGNAIRSLIHRVRAKGTVVEVQRELVDFCNRLSAALVWVGAPTAVWAEILLPVLHHTRTALGVPWNAEARILFDLQKACVDYEREREALGVVEWALSLGEVPVRRPLPAERDVRIAGHVLAALDKVPKTRLPEEPRQALVAFLVALAAHAERNVRSNLGPRLEAALDSVGLTAQDVTERASRRKLVDELLDQILKDRFFDFGQMRDALARNNIKLQDISSDELMRGDALLRLDRLLSRELDGVYRPGEIYLRSLQKLSSLGFGSRIGRFLSLYLLLPFIAAYVVLAGFEHTVGLLLVKLFDFRHVAYVSTVPLVCGTVLAFGLIHSEAARRVALALWRGVKLVLRTLFVTIPVWIWNRDFVRALLRTDGFRQFARFVLKPALLSGLVTLIALSFVKPALTRAGVFGAAFLAANLLFNSTWGRALEEQLTDWSIRSFRQLQRKLLPGIFRLIVALFKRGLEIVERLIYFVDEKLIFRQGESRATFFAKAVLGVFWFFTTYLIRIYVNLLIEPEVNPIKHFPVVTVAAKIMLPFSAQIHTALMKPLVPLFGVLIAESLVAPTIFVLPGFFGFLVWELKENWRLYRMNKNPHLQPAVIGSHGETMVQFMKPGLHSGTIPKVYSKLRQASRKLDRSALKHTEALRAVEGSIRKFIERELIFLLTESPAWGAGPLSLGKIELSSNRVRVELFCGNVSSEPALIVFDEQSGYLLSQVPSLGFISKLNIVDRVVLENGLTGLYKMAGVDLVREQVSQLLDGSAYDIGDEGLVVWPDASYRNEIVYALDTHAESSRARLKSGEIPLPPPLPVARLVFAKQAVDWASWVAAFATRKDPPPRLNQGPSLFASGQTEASFDRAATLKLL